ncbi:hypothetical protein ACRRTK_014958 [Alexandromys fortis]
MKLLILTCLMAAALAMPNQYQDSSEAVASASSSSEQAAVAQVFPQFYQQYETYPFWPFIPQDVQHITPEYVLNTAKPIAPKTAEETKVWWILREGKH